MRRWTATCISMCAQLKVFKTCLKSIQGYKSQTMTRTTREYTCKYGCGVGRSRKNLIQKHEDECYYNFYDVIRKSINDMKHQLQSMQKTIDKQSADILTLQLRTKKAVRQQQIDDLDEFRPDRFVKTMSSASCDQLFEKVYKVAGSPDRYVETFCELYLKTCKPFFIVLSASKIGVKGFIGHVRGKGDIGRPGGYEVITSGLFYDAFIAEVLFVLEDRLDREYNSLDITSKKLQSVMYQYPERGESMTEYKNKKSVLRSKIVKAMKANEWKKTDLKTLIL